MTNQETPVTDRDKIIQGLGTVLKKVLEFKKYKNTELVIIRDNKIVLIKPEDFDKL